jgi:hypothetical protein
MPNFRPLYSDSVGPTTSYRLIIHIATSAVGLTQFKFDNVSVGPSSASVGSNQEVVVRGAGNGGESITANVTDIPFTEVEDTTSSWDGDSFTTPETGYYIISGNIRATASISSSNVQLYVDRGSGAALEKTIGYSDGVQYTVFSGNVYLEKGDVATIRSSDNITLQNSTTVHTIHIQKVGTSSEATVGGRRDVVAEGAGNGGGAITANVTDIDFTETRDTSDSFDGTIFTAPESGDYDFNGFIRFTAEFRLDGVQDKRVGTAGASSSSHEINGSVYLEKGQQLSFRSNVGATLNNVTTDHHIHIQKLNSGKTALETETVAARYTSNNGQSISGTLEFEDLDFDTHNAYNTSTGEYTVPASGYYQVKSSYYTASVSFTLNNALTVGVYINGTKKEESLFRVAAASTTAHFVSCNANCLYLNKGDIVTIEAASSIAVNMGTTAERNIFSIARLK